MDWHHFPIGFLSDHSAVLSFEHLDGLLEDVVVELVYPFISSIIMVSLLSNGLVGRESSPGNRAYCGGRNIVAKQKVEVASGWNS